VAKIAAPGELQETPMGKVENRVTVGPKTLEDK
jgi:hypothetical protein